MPLNIKIYNLEVSRSLEKKQFNKLFRKTINDIRIKGFLKNKDKKKYKYSDISIHIFLYTIVELYLENVMTN